jgi:hypothetical protein
MDANLILGIVGGLMGLLVVVTLAMFVLALIGEPDEYNNLEYLDDAEDYEDTRKVAPLLGVVRPRKQDWND